MLQGCIYSQNVIKYIVSGFAGRGGREGEFFLNNTRQKKSDCRETFGGEAKGEAKGEGVE